MMKGFQLGTYIFEEKLGEGGMAEVWRARNPLLNTQAAVKFLVPKLAGNPEIEKRFLAEGKRQAALQHPNIVSAFDFHYVDNRSYLVMRFVDGENLEQRLFKLQSPMSASEAVGVSRDVLSALEYAHAQGVVHRDIKPSNLLVENGGRVHVLDFGIALVLGEERLTRVGTAIGTPHYMSPEQIVGARTIDGRSDIYSFGCVLYQMLTQATPFDATEQDGNVDYIVKDKHLREQPAPPSKINAAIPEYLDKVILRCLAKKPEERYRTCADVLAALSGARPAAATAPGRTPTVIESVTRQPPLPPRPSHTTVQPQTAPPRPISVSVPPIVRTAPKTNAGKGPLWAGAGIAVVCLATAGYFATHRGSADPQPKPDRVGSQQTAKSVPEKPPGDQAPQLAVNRPAKTDGNLAGAKSQPPRGIPSPESGPGRATVTNPPVPVPKVPPVEPLNVDKLLSEGKMQLAEHKNPEARESFRQAADAGNAQAMVLLGVMYAQGLGGPKSDSDAANLFQQASGLGYASGSYNLGLMYEGDKGVAASPGNAARAALLYQKAVEQRGGNPSAAFRLGYLYEIGRGVPREPAKARRYYELSGIPEAKARLANLPPQ